MKRKKCGKKSNHKCGKTCGKTCGHKGCGRDGCKQRVWIFLVLAVVGIGVFGFVSAKYRKIRSADKFYRAIAKYNLGVIMFYEKDRDLDKQQKRNMREAKNVFKNLSRKRFYKDGDVLFVSVNIARGDLAELASQYNISQLPTVMLFYKGKPLQDEQGNIVSVSGYLNHSQLETFIDQNFADDIEDIIKEKEKIRQQRARERAMYGPRVSFGFGFGYPGYYGYPYGWPYYGYGPYYGGYYGGPGFGISFGI